MVRRYNRCCALPLQAKRLSTKEEKINNLWQLVVKGFISINILDVACYLSPSEGLMSCAVIIAIWFYCTEARECLAS